MKTIRWTAIVLLAFLGLTSVIGGVPLIIDPSGKLLQMPLDLLRHSPFDSFLIPGIILLCANGLLGLFICWLALKRARHYGFWTAFEGCVLFGWIAVECWMIRAVSWPHWLYGAVAVGLMLTGALLWRAGVRETPRRVSTV